MNISRQNNIQLTGNGTSNQANGRQEVRLRQACEDFEALMFSQLLKAMRSSMPDNGLLPQSSGERMFQEMLDGQYAQELLRA